MLIDIRELCDDFVFGGFGGCVVDQVIVVSFFKLCDECGLLVFGDVVVGKICSDCVVCVYVCCCEFEVFVYMVWCFGEDIVVVDVGD